jgi:hypothetical protein
MKCLIKNTNLKGGENMKKVVAAVLSIALVFGVLFVNENVKENKVEVASGYSVMGDPPIGG